MLYFSLVLIILFPCRGLHLLFIRSHGNVNNLRREKLLMNSAEIHSEIAPYNTVNMIDKAILVQGEVMAGYGRGSKKLGFPTANLPHFHLQIVENCVSNGVYCGWCKIEDEVDLYNCVSNIGVSPTFVGQENRINIIEIHILNRERALPDFYGKQLRVALVGNIRQEKKFNSLDELISQIKMDAEQANSVCNSLLLEDRPDRIYKDFTDQYFSIPMSTKDRPLLLNDFTCQEIETNRHDNPAYWGMYKV